jgi:ankyrin repeat protein
MTITTNKEQLTVGDLVEGATLCHLAVENRDFETLNKATNQDLLNTDIDGETALHYAVCNNDIEISEFLINKYPELLNYRCNDNKTPFDLAKEYKDEYDTYIKIYNHILRYYCK